jgi:hypothetical protein
MKARPENIERLLNGYIDGELTVRQKTEVKRLLANDSQVAARLRQLEKCRILISALPVAEAPSEMAEDIMARLARRSLLGEEPAVIDERAGTRDLFLRKFLTAAAMIALMAVLAIVVYTIVAPPPVPHGPSTADDKRTTEVIQPPQTVLAKFNGRLELKTAAFKEMDAFIDRAVAENGFVECTGIERLAERTTYVLTCGHSGLNRLLERLEKNWARLDSATLFVETDLFGRPVVVDAVTTDQIAEVTTQTTSQDTVRVAKDLALLNSLTEQLRAGAVLVPSDTMPDLIRVERPVITGGRTIEKATVDQPNVELAIVLTRSK